MIVKIRQFLKSKEIDTNKRNIKIEDEDSYYIDDQLYSEHFVIERINAWFDGFKNLIIRYETNPIHWLGLHHLVYSCIILRKKMF